ncbi:hypothetical protein HYV50_02830 [Candidatus Pacearchaeota archaeon]|nr:hypothetical protein [Candidatus Pacearchaeota archaeon]
MMCKSWCELVIAIVILIFALFLWTWAYTQWVIVIAAIVLAIHSFTCKKCFVGMHHTMPGRKR